MFGHAAPMPAVERIATANTDNGTIVTAFHILGRRAIYVACSQHGVLATNIYGTDSDDTELRMCRAHANIRANAHAASCKAVRR